MTPEERASDLTKWVAADLRPRQWAVIRDSIVEALGEERRRARGRPKKAARYAGTGDLSGRSVLVAAAIRTRNTYCRRGAEGARCEATPEGCGRGLLSYVETAAEGRPKCNRVGSQMALSAACYVQLDPVAHEGGRAARPSGP
jgi:hypothetical protein